jgi:predicted small secreted protein
MILINRRILKNSLLLCKNIIKANKLIKICKNLYKDFLAINGNIIETILLPNQRMKKYLLKIFQNQYKREFTLILFLEISCVNSIDFFHLNVNQLI